MKTAVIGVGNMGSKYACLIQNGQVPGLELAAITRVCDPYRRLITAEVPSLSPPMLFLIPLRKENWHLMPSLSRRLTIHTRRLPFGLFAMDSTCCRINRQVYTAGRPALWRKLLVCEGGKLMIGELAEELGMKEAEYRGSSTDYFRKIKGNWSEIIPEREEDPYGEVLRAFSNACLEHDPSVAAGSEGRKSLLISNAAYLSSWEHRMIEIPEIGSVEERAFEAEYESWLRRKIGE